MTLNLYEIGRMKINRGNISWQEERPDCKFLWEIGKRYPVAVRCVVYETNFQESEDLKKLKLLN